MLNFIVVLNFCSFSFVGAFLGLISISSSLFVNGLVKFCYFRNFRSTLAKFCDFCEFLIRVQSWIYLRNEPRFVFRADLEIFTSNNGNESWSRKSLGDAK